VAAIQFVSSRDGSNEAHFSSSFSASSFSKVMLVGTIADWFDIATQEQVLIAFIAPRILLFVC
jgi:hypothetical protein